MNQQPKKQNRQPKRKLGKKEREEQRLNSVSKSNNSKQVFIIVRELGGFPDRMRTFMKTSSTANALGANTTASKGFSQNLNNPYVTTLGWPALSSVYDSYLIHGCKIIAEFVNTSTTVPVRINIAPYDIDKLTAFPLAVDDLMVAQPHAVTGALSVSGGGSDVRKLQRSIDVATLSGTKVTTAVETLTGYTGSVNSTHAFANPIVSFAWYVSAQTMTGVNLGTNQIYVAVEIIHDIEFYERLPLY